MKPQVKKFISVFLVAIIGFAGIGNAYFLEKNVGSEQSDNHKISYSDFIPQFDQALEFSPAKINVPVFKALDTVFDLFSISSEFFLAIVENGSLKADWLERVHCFFCVHTLLFPFHYFW